MLSLAAALAIGATLLGEAIAARIQRPTGPVIIAVAAVAFFGSLLVRRER